MTTTTTSTALMQAARVKVATLAPASAPTELFVLHGTNQPFEKSPIAKRNGFEIVSRRPEILQSFGLSFAKEYQFEMVVRIGHAPFSTDGNREGFTADDINRIADILEEGSWAPGGVQQIWYTGSTLDKGEPNWWITEMTFRIVFLSAVVTS